MSDESSQWNAIAQYSFLRVFANDDTIDADELAMIERLAMADGVVDDRERDVLSKIFSRVSEDMVAADVWNGIVQFKTRHGVP